MPARLLSILLLTLAAIGCQSAQPPLQSRTDVELLPSGGLVALPHLAEDLELDYRGGGGRIIELSAPPDRVMFVADSRRVVVNGETVSMETPCMRRGEEYVLTEEDARRLGETLERLRSVRTEPRPLPLPEVVAPAVRTSPTLPPDWRPPVRSRDWRHIVVHHMAAERGSAAMIDRIHRLRGMDSCGYHFVVGNGSMTGDGEIEVCGRWRKQTHGAHARVRPDDDNYWNLHSIGICLIGDFRFRRPSDRQLDALVALVRALRLEYGIPPERVLQHAHVKPTLCPGPLFPWAEFQERIR